MRFQVEDLWVGIILFCLILLMLCGNGELAFILLGFMIIFIVAYMGPFVEEPPYAVFKGCFIVGLLWLFVDFVLGIKFFAWFFMAPPTGPLQIINLDLFIPIILVLVGAHGIIKHETLKQRKALKEQKKK